eukprot:scaffold14974_cov195-Amphora_coffeaeformis.AAC.53
MDSSFICNNDDNATSSTVAARAIQPLSKKARLSSPSPWNNHHDALLPVIGFLTRHERWKVAETCRSMCQLVEAWSHGAIAAFARECTDNDGFAQRLVDSAANYLHRKYSSQHRVDDNHLPHRFLLGMMKNTHLYKLEMMQGIQVADAKTALSYSNVLVTAALGKD